MLIGETIYRFIRVPDPANNGANVDADSTPTAVLRKNGVTVGSAAVSVAKISTGYYQASVLIDAAHGWAIGDTWSIDTTYAVSGDSTTRAIGGGTIKEFTGIAAGSNGGLPTVDANGRTPSQVGGMEADVITAAAIADDAIGDDQWAVTGVAVTFSQSAAAIASTLTGQTLTVTTADRLTISITGAGNVSARTELWFALKSDRADADADALCLISENNGLEVINGAAAETPANGSITVTDQAAGDMTIVLDEAESAKLAALASRNKNRWALKLKTASNVYTLLEGKATIQEGIVQDYT